MIKKCVNSTNNIKKFFFGLLVLFTLSDANAVTVTYDFNGLTSGSLTGQDGWNNPTPTGGNYNDITVGSGTGVNTSLAAGYSSTGGNATSAASKNIGNLGLTSTQGLDMQFSFRAATSASATYAYFGVGIAPTGADPAPATFGAWGGVFSIRQEGYGSITNAKTSAGADYSVVANHWYDVRSIWDIGTSTASLFVRDLTLGQSTYSQLYFDAAQTTSTANIGVGVKSIVSQWDQAFIRVAGTNAFVDNITVTTIPEPSHYFFMTALICLSFLIRDKFRKQGCFK